MTPKYDRQGARYKLTVDLANGRKEKESLLELARHHGREEEFASLLKERKGSIFRRDGRSLIELLDDVCTDADTASEKLLLDERSPRGFWGGKIWDSADGWAKYWNQIKDGRVMASMGDLYANFKIIKKMRKQGTREEQAAAQLYLNHLREDFAWDRSNKEGGIVTSTRLFYTPSLETRIVQHYQCPKPKLTKEKVLDVDFYEGVPVEEVANRSSGLLYLQTILDTEDDAETIVQTLEFIGGRRRGNIICWSAYIKSDKYFTRARMPERAVWFGCVSDILGLYASNNLGGSGAARGVRLEAQKI